MEELAARGREAGEPSAGVDDLAVLLDEQPLRESTAVALARGLLAGGRQADALAVLVGSGDGLPDLLRLAAGSAAAANVANNLPAYLALEPVAGSPLRLVAVLVGVNVGCLVAPWASLATLLWHGRLTSMGVEVRWRGVVLGGLGVAVVAVPLAVVATVLVGA